MPTLYEPIATPMAPLFSEGLNLFKGTPSPKHVLQQQLTNCPLPAVLAAMANVNPDRFKTMIQERPATAESWFYGKPVTSAGKFKIKRIITVRFQHAAVEISPILYFNNLMKPRFTCSSDGGGWASYVEKAYVAYRAQYQYSNLDFLTTHQPLTVERIMEDFVHDFTKLEIGENAGTLLRDLEPEWLDPDGTSQDRFSTSDFSDLNAKKLKEKAIDIFKLASKRTTVATTPEYAPNHDALNLVGPHTYAVLGYSKGTVRLYDAMRAKTLEIKGKDFLKAFDAVFQSRPKN